MRSIELAEWEATAIHVCRDIHIHTHFELLRDNQEALHTCGFSLSQGQGLGRLVTDITRLGDHYHAT